VQDGAVLGLVDALAGEHRVAMGGHRRGQFQKQAQAGLRRSLVLDQSKTSPSAWVGEILRRGAVIAKQRLDAQIALRFAVVLQSGPDIAHVIRPNVR
jgi:hypothetical protein